MKKHFFSSAAAFTCSAFMLFGTFVNAQNDYYQAGVDYVYRSLKDDDDSKVSILTVQFNSSGVATITRSEAASKRRDAGSLYALAPAGDVTISSSEGDPMEIEIDQDGEHYWLIAMDDPRSPQRLSNSRGVEVTCACKQGGDACNVSSLVQTNTNTITSRCAAKTGHTKCQIGVKNKNGGLTTAGGALLIKAQSVVIN